MPVPEIAICVGRDGCGWEVRRAVLGGAVLTVDAGPAVVELHHDDLEGLSDEVSDLLDVLRALRDEPPAERVLTEPERIAREIGA